MRLSLENRAVRYGASIAAGLAATGTAYATESYRVPHPDTAAHNAKVKACARQLGGHAAVAAQVPGPCEPFRFQTSFLLDGNKVTVKGPKESATEPEEVYVLPASQDFEEARSWDPDALSEDRIFVYGIGVGVAALTLMFTSGEARDRREAAATPTQPTVASK